MPDPHYVTAAIGGVIRDYDLVEMSQNSTQDIFTFKHNSTTIGTITITYTDATKATLASVQRTLS